MSTRKVLSFYVLMVILVSGCAAPTAEPTPILPTVTDNPPTATLPQPSSTPLPPTVTPSATATVPTPTQTYTTSPTVTLAPTETASPTSTSTQLAANTQTSGQLPSASNNSVLIYFIHLDTGGSVGCGDSAIAVGAGVQSSGDIEKDVLAGLKSLFSYKTEFVGRFYNPLYASNIRVQKVNYNSKSGLITVDMTGTYKPSGDSCDNSRVKAQVWMTIRQYRGVTSTNIYLNGIPFGDRVSNDK